ncbi:DUF6910 family protein [Actinoplanes friuliensis]|uniref:Uncharacterized protein n=1 Tax=Actinoplanes friuliensis DSM 7358 TaxID=1246995 RepID=U5W1X9_9ACTN|nr:hypothetical protein [Actinoplanes friuliensis]AGZ41931.1 hypothetical protein AFR_18265 [Actinoplanes friuliensis DSM 7358]
MKIEIEATADLWFGPGLPVRAASAVAPFGDGWLVVQDDATHAAWLRPGGIEAVRVADAVDGHETFSAADGTKHLKPDFEAACPVPGGVLLLGSGSTGARMRASLVTPDPAVTTTDLTAVYRRVAEVLGLRPDRLNLEGACLVGDRLRWFQRGGSAAVDLDFPGLLDVLTGRAEPDAVTVRAAGHWDLGSVAGVPLSITDAVALPDGRIVVSAAAEDTPNPVDDGPVVGSALALLDDTGVLAIAPVPDGPYKIEGLAVRQADPAGVSLIAVVDADDPLLPSTRLDLRLHW